MENKILRVLPTEENKFKGHLHWGGQVYPCFLGEAGTLSVNQKKEGDGATPFGFFPIRSLYYRKDRLGLLTSRLPTHEFKKEDCWSDEIKDPYYNQFFSGTSKASHEKMWREDNLYDVVIPLGYNDQEIKPGAGSCIFFHIAKDGFSPTKGCVAIDRDAMLEILKKLTPGCFMRIYKSHLPHP